MLKIGVTGGIGSGKSTICRIFSTLGIPFFKADEAARYLMEHDKGVMAAVRQLLGENVYSEGRLNRQMVSDAIFGNDYLRQRLAELVHPATSAHANEWMTTQKAAYAIKEAAIFFESGTHVEMDLMIGVFAPEALRVARATKRGGLSEQKVRTIIASQMDEVEKMERCDYVILNDDVQAVIPQVLNLHSLLLEKAASRH